jgi:hypothetical protein
VKARWHFRSLPFQAMTEAERVADAANRDGIPGEVNLRDAEIAIMIVGVVLGPRSAGSAAGPARIISAYRRECEAAERVRVALPYVKKLRGGQPGPHSARAPYKNIMGDFPYNPEHPIGTCARCGQEMIYNVPRMGPNGGFVHKASGKLMCDDLESKLPSQIGVFTHPDLATPPEKLNP